MTPKNFDIEESNVIVLHSEESKEWNTVWAIFNVSKTTQEQWIAICWYEKSPQEDKQPFEMLTVFDSADEMLRWVAFRQKKCGDEIRSGWHTLEKNNEMDWLNKQAQYSGYENWEHFCSEELKHIGSLTNQPDAKG